MILRLHGRLTPPDLPRQHDAHLVARWHVGGAMRAATVWLLLLVAQNTSKTLIMRAAVGQGQPQFLYSAAVLATEALKASVSIAWVLVSGGSLRSIAFFLRAEWRLFLRVMVPAAIYNCQQMLEFVALSRLEAPVFSIIVQVRVRVRIRVRVRVS